LVPVDDANQIPVVLIELKIELALFVDDQLGSRVKRILTPPCLRNTPTGKLIFG
jgi:hypothetical protein